LPFAKAVGRGVGKLPDRLNEVCCQHDDDRGHDQPSHRSKQTSNQFTEHSRAAPGFDREVGILSLRPNSYIIFKNRDRRVFQT
jgi:hypothetical protein